MPFWVYRNAPAQCQLGVRIRCRDSGERSGFVVVPVLGSFLFISNPGVTQVLLHGQEQVAPHLCLACGNFRIFHTRDDTISSPDLDAGLVACYANREGSFLAQLAWQLSRPYSHEKCSVVWSDEAPYLFRWSGREVALLDSGALRVFCGSEQVPSPCPPKAGICFYSAHILA